jgi:sulfinoalanine decarboxylase
LYENKITVVGFGAFKGQVFVRLVTINANNEKVDILNFFKVMEEFAAKNPNLKKVAEAVQVEA